VVLTCVAVVVDIGFCGVLAIRSFHTCTLARSFNFEGNSAIAKDVFVQAYADFDLWRRSSLANNMAEGRTGIG